MPYTPDPLDVAAPTSAEKASTAPAEFRAVKLYLRDSILPLIDSKLPKSGGTISGNLTVTGTITGASLTGNGTAITGISSGQITTALGYIPYNNTNPSGYITGINGGMVTSALGYVPYNASNPTGYITGVSAGMVNSAYGFNIRNMAARTLYVQATAPPGPQEGDIWIITFN